MDSDLQQQSMKFLQTSVQEALENYELRPPQQGMMSSCARTIENGGTLIAEAGTGTGKTFAYLVAAILSGKKTIIATKTINLQEQLVSKDLQFLASLRAFDYAIAQGSSTTHTHISDEFHSKKRKLLSVRNMLAVLATLFALTLQWNAAVPRDSPKSGLTSNLVGQLDRVKKQVTAIGAAVPQDDFDWRLSEGERLM